MSELDELDEIIEVLEHPSEPRLFPAWVTDSLAEDLRAKRDRIEKWGAASREAP